VLTWKLRGTTFNRSYFLLQASALPIDGTACGLLPTPISQGLKVSDAQGKTQFIDLNLLPTPTTDERDAKYQQGGTNLRAALKGMLPTPNAMDWNTARSEEALAKAKEKHGSALQDTLRQRAGQGSQLNPRFVAEMMGFSPNWTESPFQSGGQTVSKHTGTP
jgi:hypothetical protein